MQEITIARQGGDNTSSSQQASIPASTVLPTNPTDNTGKPTRKLFIRTFGCQMNEYDSAKMAAVLGAESALELTQTPDDADTILFNT